MLIEVCTETPEECINAEKNGAHRIELCSSLDIDGLTPDFEVLKEVLSVVSIPVKVMIRCRAGDFIYTSDELDKMILSVQKTKQLQIAGFVFGALMYSENKHRLDVNAIKQICAAAEPFPVTVHKCIDWCEDICTEIYRLADVTGVSSILSSGGKATAAEGIDMLNEMNNVCDLLNIELIAAGKITALNLQTLKESTAINSFHGRKIVSGLF
jgi:copper homeostasis protein